MYNDFFQFCVFCSNLIIFGIFSGQLINKITFKNKNCFKVYIENMNQNIGIANITPISQLS